MHVRCPHCRNPMELVEESSLDDVTCPSCGSSFSLVGSDDTVTHQPLTDETIAHFRLTERPDHEPEEDASFFAVFLLTELEVTEAFPILLEVLRLPDEGPFELLGDGVHDLVAPILALFSGGNTGEIGGIVLDSNVNMYLRWSAAKAYKYLVRDELKDLGTLCKNRVRWESAPELEFERVTLPTSLQRRVFELLSVSLGP